MARPLQRSAVEFGDGPAPSRQRKDRSHVHATRSRGRPPERRALLAVVAFLLTASAIEAAPAARQKAPAPLRSGYADAAEGLRVYYEIYGKGEPIVVLAGGLGDISSMAQTIGPLSRERQVIGIDLEGHGRTALRATPMSHERNGDDVAAVLRHLKIAKADVAGYSHGGDAAIRMAIQHPEMVRNLIVISTAAERDGWYPEALKGMEAVSSSHGRADAARRRSTSARPPSRRIRISSRCCSTAWAS